jgi:peptidoglycan/xylan/chitin deacetylase (PgdA/CDA1 family)
MSFAEDRGVSRGWRVAWLIAVVLVAGCGGGSSPRPQPSRRTPAAARPHVARARRPAAARPVTWGAAARRAAIPILMYHVVTAAPPGVPYPELWVAQRTFAAEMRALRRAGYHAITLSTALRAWRHGGGLPRRPVVLTFDDGYRSDFTHAAPVLRRFGWPGVLNLALANLRPGDITTPEVRRLIAWGWEIASHTLTHPDLTTLGPAALRHELMGSRTAIERRFGQPARVFCYPYGHYDAGVVAAVRAAGYQAATTENPGLATGAQPLTLNRVRVNGSDTAAGLLARLRALAHASG